MSQAKETYAMQKKHSKCKSALQDLNVEIKRIEAVVTALTSEKVFSPEMLGAGKARGGNKDHKLNRYQVLDRLRRIGNLTQQQNSQWDFFKTHYDEAQANARGENWGQEFAEIVQGVLLEMLHGDKDAFSKFVKRETDRVLEGRVALVVPGIPT